jgi:hypothetical protein
MENQSDCEYGGITRSHPHTDALMQGQHKGLAGSEQHLLPENEKNKSKSGEEGEEGG